MNVRIKRIYDPPSEEDGFRVLVDRLWPRGVKKADARLDHWAKYLAPSRELRTWFAHEPSKFAEFRARYCAELADKDTQVARLLEQAGSNAVTLLFAAKERRCNHARVLQEFLNARRRRAQSRT